MTARPARVLVTNDDGASSAGLASLVAAATAVADEVVVVAPLAPCSGTGTAIQRGALTVGPPEVVPLELPGTAAAYAVDGWPAEAVLLGLSGLVGPRPDVVLCGVNEGPNIGTGMVHSGTVGAAVTAMSLGAPALAVSLDDSWFLGGRTEVYGPGLRWDVAAALGAGLGRTLAGGPPALLVINVPSVAPADLAGVRAARLALARPVLRPGPDGGRVLELPAPDPAADTDAALLAAGWVTVSGWPDPGGPAMTRAVTAARAVLDGLRAAEPVSAKVRPTRPLSPSTARTVRQA